MSETIDAAPVATWSPEDALPKRPVLSSMARGAMGKCPHCGKGRLFASFLRVADRCDACGEELHHHRADDAPPYFTILGVGHIVLPLLMTVELAYAPPVWLHLALWLPLTVILSLLFLPRIKGAIVGLQWALRMHGFGEPSEEGRPALATAPAQVVN